MVALSSSFSCRQGHLLNHCVKSGVDAVIDQGQYLYVLWNGRALIRQLVGGCKTADYDSWVRPFRCEDINIAVNER